MLFRFLTAIILALLAPVMAQAGDYQAGEDRYVVTTLRAAPGQWVKLKALIEAQGEAGSTGSDGHVAPYRIRHSQGDQWDFMLIRPISSLPDFMEERGADTGGFYAAAAALSDYAEDWLVRGPDHAALARHYRGAGLFHVEMFRARAGMKDRLVDQRIRENAFLAATNAVENAIFVGEFGADWDVMTIGFHQNLKSFAAGGGASDAEEEKAARDNGFDGVGDLAPYLRSLLTSHNDTLAVAMR